MCTRVTLSLAMIMPSNPAVLYEGTHAFFLRSNGNNAQPIKKDPIQEGRHHTKQNAHIVLFNRITKHMGTPHVWWSVSRILRASFTTMANMVVKASKSTNKKNVPSWLTGFLYYIQRAAQNTVTQIINTITHNTQHKTQKEITTTAQTPYRHSTRVLKTSIVAHNPSVVCNI